MTSEEEEAEKEAETLSEPQQLIGLIYILQNLELRIDDLTSMEISAIDFCLKLINRERGWFESDKTPFASLGEDAEEIIKTSRKPGMPATTKASKELEGYV